MFTKKKKKHKITFILKSGKEITFRCNDFSIKRSGNELTGYTVTDGDGKLFYVNLSEIAAILQ